ncbi:nucleolar protein of 40 kDa-like [Limulus polyphemus]|uniref:Nucleolar protein of 40 kDa-like n=1 Tax=Limulus polyphemus TaxID=6850 RepID=A0ABM1BQ77_LIMPO|nr:nucleolar protein of 40 kDa-like [Limulus polyphemus]
MNSKSNRGSETGRNDLMKVTKEEFVLGNNAIFKGEVASVQQYGAFIKIPGCAKNGLVHKSQISNSKVDDATEVLIVGEKVWCKVLSFGEEDDLKISLSMKVVDQGSGNDLDPAGVQIAQDENRRKICNHYEKKKITLEAVYNTICKKCGTRGHLAKDCFQQPGGMVYTLLPDMEEQETESQQNVQTGKRKIKEKRKKTKRRKHSSTESTSDSEKYKRKRSASIMKKKKKKHKK